MIVFIFYLFRWAATPKMLRNADLYQLWYSTPNSYPIKLINSGYNSGAFKVLTPGPDFSLHSPVNITNGKH